LKRRSLRLSSQREKKRIEQERPQKDPDQPIAQSVIGVPHGPKSKLHEATCPL